MPLKEHKGAKFANGQIALERCISTNFFLRFPVIKQNTEQKGLPSLMTSVLAQKIESILIQA